MKGFRRFPSNLELQPTKAFPDLVTHSQKQSALPSCMPCHRYGAGLAAELGWLGRHNGWMMLQELTRQRFLDARRHEAESLCKQLAAALSARFAGMHREAWPEVAYAAVRELNWAGHDLASFDDNSPAAQIWVTNLTAAARAQGELGIRFCAPSYVEVYWRTPEGQQEAEAGTPAE